MSVESTAIEKWLWFLESYPEYAFVKGFEFGFGLSGTAAGRFQQLDPQRQRDVAQIVRADFQQLCSLALQLGDQGVSRAD